MRPGAPRAAVPAGTKRLLRISTLSLLVVAVAFLAVLRYFATTHEAVIGGIEEASRQIMVSSRISGELFALELDVRELLATALREDEVLRTGRERLRTKLGQIDHEVLSHLEPGRRGDLHDDLGRYADGLERYLGDFSRLNAALERLDSLDGEGATTLDGMERATSRRMVEYALASRDTTGLGQLYTLLPYCRERLDIVRSLVGSSVDRADPAPLGSDGDRDGEEPERGTALHQLGLLAGTLRTMTSAEGSIGEGARTLLGVAAGYRDGIRELDEAIRSLVRGRDSFFASRDVLLGRLGELDDEATATLPALQERVRTKTVRAEVTAALIALFVGATFLVTQVLMRRVSGQLRAWGAEATAAREATEEVNRRLQRENAERREAELALSRARDELEGRVLERTGELSAANLALQGEVAQRARAESDLAEEKDRLAVILGSIGDGVIATDVHDRVVLLNRGAEALTGWSQREAEGKDFAEVFRAAAEPGAEERPNPLREAVQTGRVVEVSSPVTIVDRSGGRQQVAELAAPMVDREGRTVGGVLVFRDVAERLKMEAEVLRVKKLESVGLLAGGIAHDFNNLLQGVFGYISVARLRFGEPEAARMLDEAERALHQAVSLTNQLLTFSKGGKPVKTRLDLQPVVEGAIRLTLSGSRVKCAVAFAEGLRAVDGDGGQLAQVVQNIVLNAEQAMPEGGRITVRARNVRVPGEATPPALAAGDYVLLEIADEGPGIPAEILPRIFDPYFTTKEAGSGLGLATSFSIVRNHGGVITASSEPGAGSTFRIYLPAAPGEPRAGEEAARATAGRAPHARKILLMDDEQIVRDVGGELLAALGHEVAFADRGEEAIEKFAAAREAGAPFDAVILDLTIRGGMGGAETIRRLRELDPAVRAVVSSGYSDEADIAEHRRLGFQVFLKKPYNLRQLREALASLPQE